LSKRDSFKLQEDLFRPAFRPFQIGLALNFRFQFPVNNNQMSFDRIKAMRNAERFLAQGKIRAAINEYKRVVDSDPRDYNTLNMLGDLYAKTSDTQEAINCFNQVAEHYGKQGFAQKAIAIYNKISRLTPESLEISAKLAELYYVKGSVAEARSHYTVLAERYQRMGNKSEALDVLNRIAQLDTNNSEIYLKIAELCLQENQTDEAAAAFFAAGARLSGRKQYESAIKAFNKGLEIKPNDLTGLKGIVKAQINLGDTDEAAQTLEKVLESEPYNSEVIFLLVDCYLDTDNPKEAERIVIQLVEREPANYPKFLDVFKGYLKESDLVSAARILSMTTEHLLVGGQASEFGKLLNEILARDPEQIDALRLLVRLHSWQRNETELKEALERLAEAAKLSESVEDERYALTQLVMMLPHEGSYAQRLQEINEIHGFVQVPLDIQPSPQRAETKAPELETFAQPEESYSAAVSSEPIVTDYAEFKPDINNGNGSYNGSKDFQFADETLSAEIVEDYASVSDYGVVEPAAGDVDAKSDLDPYEKARLQQELESVEFYISQNYLDLAEKSLDVLENEFGSRVEIEDFRRALNSKFDAVKSEQAEKEEVIPVEAKHAPIVETPADSKVESDFMDEFRSELGFEESEDDKAGDYDTHYHLGIAYKEMGLMEDAIREFQDAVKLVHANDGTRRFLLCCNMLGHCFMEKGMTNLALMWYKRCLETANLGSEERHGITYEVANAYEAGEDFQKAIEYFEEIYAENVDYRDVAERLKFLRAQ
jgi:tetratricopeptide (TPR) repeat protein